MRGTPFRCFTQFNGLRVGPLEWSGPLFNSRTLMISHLMLYDHCSSILLQWRRKKIYDFDTRWVLWPALTQSSTRTRSSAFASSRPRSSSFPVWTTYHVVIFHFLFINKNNIRIHPSKAPLYLAPKLPEPIHPLYFSIRIGQYFVLFKNVLETWSWLVITSCYYILSWGNVGATTFIWTTFRQMTVNRFVFEMWLKSRKVTTLLSVVPPNVMAPRAS